MHYIIKKRGSKWALVGRTWKKGGRITESTFKPHTVEFKSFGLSPYFDVATAISVLKEAKKDVKQTSTTQTTKTLTHPRYWIESKFRKYKSRAKSTNKIFTLDLQDFYNLMFPLCTYCNTNPCTGLDRIDNNNGYTKENCVGCCTYCNRAKSDLSLIEFKKLITAIAKQFEEQQIAAQLQQRAA